MLKRNNRSLWPATVLFLTILVLFIMGIDLRLKSSILIMAQSKVQLHVTEIINTVVQNKIAEEAEYQQMFDIHKDNDGSIALIQANTNYLNQIIAKTSLEITQQLKSLDNVVEIPLGQLTGSNILAAYGSKFKVKIIPEGQIEIKLENKFEEAGINQTRHLISFIVKTKLKIAVPYMEQEIEAHAEVLLAETIIIGKVPNAYFKLNEDLNSVWPGLIGLSH